MSKFENIIRNIKELENKIDEFLENFPNTNITFENILEEFERLSKDIKDFYRNHKVYIEKYREKIKSLYKDIDKKRKRINRLFNLMEKYRKEFDDEKKVQRFVKNVDKLILNLVELVELYNKTLLLNVDINTYIDNMAEVTINFNRVLGKIYALEAILKLGKAEEKDTGYIY